MLPACKETQTRNFESEEIKKIVTNLETLGEDYKRIKRRLEDAERRFEMIR